MIPAGSVSRNNLEGGGYAARPIAAEGGLLEAVEEPQDKAELSFFQ